MIRRFTRAASLTVTYGAAALLLLGLSAGPSACHRAGRTTSAAPAQTPYPPVQPLATYEADPAWRHKVGVLGRVGLPPEQHEDLLSQLTAIGFNAVALNQVPADGGEYNTMLEVGPQQITARVLAPTAGGDYPRTANETAEAFNERVVDALASFLKPVAPVAEPEGPPPPDPKEVCREECGSQEAACARTCCEAQLGSDPAKCDAAGEAATKCASECDAKAAAVADEAGKKKALADCRDGCSRGKHSAYPGNPAIARDASAYFKCNASCAPRRDACDQACETPAAPETSAPPAPGAPAAAAPAAPAGPTPVAPGAPTAPAR